MDQVLTSCVLNSWQLGMNQSTHREGERKGGREGRREEGRKKGKKGREGKERKKRKNNKKCLPSSTHNITFCISAFIGMKDGRLPFSIYLVLRSNSASFLCILCPFCTTCAFPAAIFFLLNRLSFSELQPHQPSIPQKGSGSGA